MTLYWSDQFDTTIYIQEKRLFIEQPSLFSLVSHKGSQVKLATWILSGISPSKTTAKFEGRANPIFYQKKFSVEQGILHNFAIPNPRHYRGEYPRPLRRDSPPGTIINILHQK